MSKLLVAQKNTTFNHGQLTLDFVDFICLLCVSPKIQATCSFMQDKEPQKSQKLHTSLPVAEMA